MDSAIVDAMRAKIEPLREKYAEERNKRLKKEGIDQYTPIEGEFSYFEDDPYIERTERPKIKAKHDVIVVGSGFGGLLSAVQLKEVGVDDFLIIEKAGSLGGTWYWNRYPGLACDMKSYVYLPLLEETGYMPPRNYASGQEIRQHAERIAEQWDLYDHTLFQTGVTDATWLDDKAVWLIKTDQGDEIEAKYLITAHGPMSKPKLPGIPGISSYRGHTFHTSRWDYKYTGGDMNGGLDGLKGKKVAIIGTGATSIQCIPYLAEHAEQLYVVQRTPSGVDVRAEQDTDPEWVASLKPGWHKEMVDNFNIITSGGDVEEDLIKDGWTSLFEMMKNSAAAMPEGMEVSPDEEMLAYEFLDGQKMNEIRGRIDSVVKDEETANFLKPWYRRFCKRPVFHDGFLETFNRDNVKLIDTDGKGVEEIVPSGFKVSGQQYDVDCIIFASGFEVGTDYTRRSGYDIHGRNGRSLQNKWSKGLTTLHGMHINGFPNLFVHQNAQGALPANFCHGLSEGAKNMSYVISHALKLTDNVVEVTQGAEQGWVQHCQEVATNLMGFFSTCTPGYYNLEGQFTTEASQGYGYGLGPAVFFDLMEDWRKNGKFEGLKFSDK